MTTIWAAPATTYSGTLRVPVDTGESGTPVHIPMTAIENGFYKGTGSNSINIKASTADKGSAIAIGNSAVASGVSGDETFNSFYPIAIGEQAKAYNNGSISIGFTATSGESTTNFSKGAIAIGNTAEATKRHAVALGNESSATGINAVALGDQTTSSGIKSIAIGNACSATGSRSIAIGDLPTSSHDNSIAIGGSTVATSAINQFTFGDLLFRFGSFAVADLPTASSYTGHVVYCSDGDAGSPCLAVSNGANWLRVALGTAVSAT